jgi:hypothetical protein
VLVVADVVVAFWSWVLKVGRREGWGPDRRQLTLMMLFRVYQDTR